MIEDFIKEVKKVSQPRKQKVTNSYGVKDAFRYLRKNKWLNLGRSVTESQFYAIIRSVNRRLAENLLNNLDVKFPYKMGVLTIVKRPGRVWFKDNKLHTNFRINWPETMKLWYEDPLARQNKVLIRRESNTLFKIEYDKTKTDYINAWVYEFRPIRDLKVRFHKKAAEGTIDGFLKKGYDKKY